MKFKAFQVDDGDMDGLVAKIKEHRHAPWHETTLLVRPSIFGTMYKIFGSKLNVERHAMPDGMFGIKE